MSAPCDFGLIGLGVMGRNLLLNAARNGYSVFGHDLDAKKVEALVSEKNENKKIQASVDPNKLINSLSKPRKIILLVPAGSAVDAVINELTPLLEPGDILMDGGNSYFRDTEKRQQNLQQKGIHFLGVGISGGAKGALLGPSMMPGGLEAAYKLIHPILQTLAAQYEGEPCVAYLGSGSAGHYVKMVHNGIEYGLMQLISESYGLLKQLGQYSNGELQAIYEKWNTGPLQSYLVEITANILGQPDTQGPGALLDQILDKAKQKGTGKWTSQNAMDLGIAVPTIDAAVRMRELSALKDLRVAAKDIYGRPKSKRTKELIATVHAALYFGYIVTFAQGFQLMKAASKSYSYNLDLAVISRIWRSGCIIRASLLQDIAAVYSANEPPKHLLLADDIARKVKELLSPMRELIGLAVTAGIPVPAMYSALAYFEAFTSGELPINMIQAQRDYFGSHTYERKDRPGSFSTDWEAWPNSKN